MAHGQCQLGFKPGFIQTSLLGERGKGPSLRRGEGVFRHSPWGQADFSRTTPQTALSPVPLSFGAILPPGLRQEMFPWVFRTQTRRQETKDNKGR